MILCKKRRGALVGICAITLVLLFCGCADTKTHLDATPDENYYLDIDGEYVRPGDTVDLHVESAEEAREKGKAIVTLADGIGNRGVIRYIINDFNRDNDLYHVEMLSMEPVSIHEDQQRLKMDLATGKGPDIMTSSAVPDAVQIASTGCFLDVSYYLDNSINHQNVFFPSIKAITHGEEVFGVCIDTGCAGFSVSEKVIGSQDVPDFDSFIDMLYAYADNAVLINDYQTPTSLLEFFLSSSDTLRGTVDKVNCTCDFTIPLFSKLLDVCKRYGLSSGRGYELIMQPHIYQAGLYPGKKALEEQGWVNVDFWFDDGNYPAYTGGINVMINSSSTNVEGAKAFLSYALSAKGQRYCANPTNKDVFMAKEMDELSLLEEGHSYMKNTLTHEILEELVSSCDMGRSLPKDNEEIIGIIVEEVGAFFDDSKSKEDVINILQSRVALLLSE